MFYALVALTILLTGCSSSIPVFGDNPVPPRKDFSIREKTTFLPRPYVETLDSTNATHDYIDRKLDIMLPDTLPDSTLYSKDDPVFRPIPLDSGILLSNRDMALYIKDRANAKYLRTEVKARKELQLEIIRGAVKAEGMYQETINETNKYNKEIYDKMREERNAKHIWRNIFIFATAFGAGFVLNDALDK
jgi:hypothetical protein